MLERCNLVLRRLIHKPQRPLASHVLTSHIRQRQYPNWTSFSVRYRAVSNDQFGLTTFNWDVDGHNYNILRTGSFPFVKYYCTRRPKEDLELENSMYTVLKILNLGFPCLMYGLATWMFVRVEEHVVTDKGVVTIYFLNEETEEGGH